MDSIFRNQTVIISGGIGDIGFATAVAFAKKGANVALGDVKPPPHAADFLNQLQRYEAKCSYKQVDVSDVVAVKSWVKEVEREFGIIHLIIANAGTATVAGIQEITAEQWTNELNVNLNGAFYLTKYAVKSLLKKKLPGRVVFVGSWAATQVHQHMPAYSVSKAGLHMLCKCLALELAPHGILVNEIAPGYVSAGLSGRSWKDNPEKMNLAKERVPIKQLMSAQEVADQIVYLCHPQNKHVTGSTLLMDGGLSLT